MVQISVCSDLCSYFTLIERFLEYWLINDAYFIHIYIYIFYIYIHICTQFVKMKIPLRALNLFISLCHWLTLQENICDLCEQFQLSHYKYLFLFYLSALQSLAVQNEIELSRRANKCKKAVFDILCKYICIYLRTYVCMYVQVHTQLVGCLNRP